MVLAGLPDAIERPLNTKTLQVSRNLKGEKSPKRVQGSYTISKFTVHGYSAPTFKGLYLVLKEWLILLMI